MSDSIKIAFGTVLRNRRLQQNVSQEKLAELAGLDRTYISQIERGLKSPSIQTLLALAQALHVQAHILIFDLEHELSSISSKEKAQE